LRSSEPRIFATMLSWMAKCPIARNIILDRGGSITYTTPNFVSKTAEWHDALKDAVIEVLGGLVHPIIMDVKETSIEVNVGVRHIVSGRPDFLMWIPSSERSLMLAGEVTLMSTVRHLIYGEMLFYILSCYINYGSDVAGFLVSPRSLYLLIPKIPESDRDLRRYFERESAPSLLLRLFRRVDEERAIEVAEELRKKKPWICSLCDLRSLCPISGEV